MLAAFPAPHDCHRAVLAMDPVHSLLLWPNMHVAAHGCVVRCASCVGGQRRHEDGAWGGSSTGGVANVREACGRALRERRVDCSFVTCVLAS